MLFSLKNVRLKFSSFAVSFTFYLQKKIRGEAYQMYGMVSVKNIVTSDTKVCWEMHTVDWSKILEMLNWMHYYHIERIKIFTENLLILLISRWCDGQSVQILGFSKHGPVIPPRHFRFNQSTPSGPLFVNAHFVITNAHCAMHTLCFGIYCVY